MGYIMKIFEVDRSSKMKEASALITQLYHKQNKIMQWPSSTKPTLTGIALGLGDKMITDIAKHKDLDFFIQYAAAYINLGPIFDKTAQVGTTPWEVMNDPEYYKHNKSTLHKITNMSPRAYLGAARAGFSTDETFEPHLDTVTKYAYQVLDGSPMPLPSLEYTKTVDDVNFSQEGRHRAYAAELLGASTIPVIIIAAVYPPAKMKGQLDPFAKKVFNNFK